ncbi:BREX-1 system adenine-specific DNA-methyltransferase PglX, partial [Ligilactobacillus equi]|uniref:BREX-1 system adenine-specific DNA-methyltransferase PglX n=1 Tax=Ligilactobacillus equi TaxID=137357 RepID=UPI002ED2378B
LEILATPTSKDLYRTNQANFEKIPGNPLAYWVSEKIFKSFGLNKLEYYGKTRAGMITGNNEKFVRFWQEVSYSKLGIGLHSREQAKTSRKKWFPYNKGGNFRKWYGNNERVVNWENDGYLLQTTKDSKGKVPAHAFNLPYIFKKNITWNALSSYKFSARQSDWGFLYDASGSFADINLKMQSYLLALLCSKVAFYYLTAMNPTLNFQKGNIANIPVIESNVQKNNVDTLSNTNVLLGKDDWDSFENSWDFSKHPLIQNIDEHERNWTLEEAYDVWEQEALDRFNQLKANEEELNRIFIELYGLQDELTPEEEDKDVSVRKADKERDIKSFLSYFIGCVFGRYSLDADGLAFAGGEWDDSKYQTFKPNKDNVILLTEESYYNDERDIINRLREFLTVTFGTDNVNENMRFIASVLNEKALNSGTSSEQIIRNYFVDKFYKEHVKTYQKRPIYWEMSSGRRGGFKALIYLHRYQADDFAVIRSNYLHSLQTTYAAITENLKKEVIDASGQLMRDMKKQIQNLEVKSGEIVQYDNDLQYIADQKIELDLDDGVVVNHKKVQGEKKLLSPIK